MVAISQEHEKQKADQAGPGATQRAWLAAKREYPGTPVAL